MVAEKKWIPKVVAVAVLGIAMITTFAIWDHHNYPLPGEYRDSFDFEWPGLFNSFASPAQQTALSLRYKKYVRETLKPLTFHDKRWKYDLSRFPWDGEPPKLALLLDAMGEAGNIEFNTHGEIQIFPDQSESKITPTFKKYKRPNAETLILLAGDESVEFFFIRPTALGSTLEAYSHEPSGNHIILTEIENL